LGRWSFLPNTIAPKPIAQDRKFSVAEPGLFDRLQHEYRQALTGAPIDTVGLHGDGLRPSTASAAPYYGLRGLAIDGLPLRACVEQIN
jgi:hypothetical protein